MAQRTSLRFYLDDEGQKLGAEVCRLNLQGGLSHLTISSESGLDENEVRQIDALLALNPDAMCTLLNHIADGAYQLGLRRGHRIAVDEANKASMRKQSLTPGMFGDLM